VAPKRIVITSFGESGSKHAVWSVSADGTTAQVPFPESGLTTTLGRLGAGSDGPLPSPDGKRVAYVEGGADDGTLVVRDIDAGVSTVVAAKKDRSELLITAWSSNGKRLLYSVAPLDGANGTIAQPDSSVLYFFVHDLDAHSTESVEMPCEFQAWLASGEFLVACEASTVLARVRGKSMVRLPKNHERYSQVSVGDNGTIAFVADDAGVSRVIAMDPSSFGERVVSADGKFGQYQFPKASPSGKHVAYAHLVPIGGGRRRMDVIVDRGSIARDVSDYAWIDDEGIAVSRDDQAPTVVRVPAVTQLTSAGPGDKTRHSEPHR
jgi:hypothetical protein